MAEILVLTTGGTIGALPVEDVIRQPDIKTMPPDRRDSVRQALASSFASIKTRCVSLEPRDSKFIDEAYRIEVLKTIESAPEERVLITHGTDTLLETAAFFYQTLLIHPTLKNKVIVVTGSMVPLANGKESDGYRNIDFALKHLQSCPLGPSKINIVLCGFDLPEEQKGDWRPRLYPYQPKKYVKFFHPSDDRLSCLLVRSDIKT